ncbi:putative mitochondrial ATP synthase epsilon chain [Lyophyllum shimeji]|uniref:Mitochondrial ATP synthase epsilon chain n=1 Tax=Lyophyllum shimeji TaxID=47721 RepID=A0A9P3PFJ2_LYOSH|nr:putative mitochondrial ATP synthase epsilon chain [Lyophyllum shimeji]
MSSTSWRNLFSYNRYSQITARAVRASFKEDERLVAERRGLTNMRFQRWENGNPTAHIPMSEELAREKEELGKKSV